MLIDGNSNEFGLVFQDRPMTNDEFIADNGESCPVCGTDAVMDTDPSVYTTFSIIRLSLLCIDCHHRWTAVFKLTGYVDLMPVFIASDDEQVAKDQNENTDQQPIMASSAYVQHAGNRCPGCASGDIECTGRDGDYNYVLSHIICNECASTWDEVYVLSEFINFRRPD